MIDLADLELRYTEAQAYLSGLEHLGRSVLWRSEESGASLAPTELERTLAAANEDVRTLLASIADLKEVISRH